MNTYTQKEKNLKFTAKQLIHFKNIYKFILRSYWKNKNLSIPL